LEVNFWATQESVFTIFEYSDFLKTFAVKLLTSLEKVKVRAKELKF
jgi:hypothetical protein